MKLIWPFLKILSLLNREFKLGFFVHYRELLKLSEERSPKVYLKARDK